MSSALSVNLVPIPAASLTQGEGDAATQTQVDPLASQSSNQGNTDFDLTWLGHQGISQDRTLEMVTHFHNHDGVQKAYERYRTICSNPIEVIQSLETVDLVPKAATSTTRRAGSPVGQLFPRGRPSTKIAPNDQGVVRPHSEGSPRARSRDPRRRLPQLAHSSSCICRQA